jgi:thiol-disulfide isomerase/thioredoxin
MRPNWLTVVALVALISPSLAAAAELPRYSLPVGRKLIYTTSSASKATAGESGMSTKSSIRVTVVRENPDGSRRVIIRSASSYSQASAAGVHDSPERVQLAYADIFPDGRVLPNQSLGIQAEPAAVLPPLPKDEAELSKGWSGSNEAKQETTTYTSQPAKAGEFLFSAVRDGVMDKIYLTTHKATYHFDTAKDAVTLVEREMSQDYGFHTKGTGQTKLESDETVDAKEATQLAADFEQFFAAKEKYDELMGEVEKDPEHADASIASAESAIQKARDQVNSPDARAELAKVLENHAEYAKYARESSDKFKDVLNKPAASWETTDIEGKPAKLADYRGKVVVMDFWYRGCGWCMYAMPQVKQLAADYKDKPVIVLGMNTDREEKDAKFVIDTMGLKYPTIKAEGIPEKYGVQGFPTLIIIDQDGVVRDVHVGYSRDLRAQVSKKVDELLSKPAKVGG